MTHVRNRFFIFILQALLILAPATIQAATVCCSCKGPPDPASAACLTGDPDKNKFNGEDCSTMVAAAKLPEGWSCDKAPLNESRCRGVSDGGVCQKPPTGMFTYSEAPARQGVTAVENVRPEKAGGKGDIIPILNVAIPGLTFSGNTGRLFAEYIAGATRYLLSIVAVAATVMFIYGAFLYLIGTAITSIRSGKQMMTDAVVGMLLVLGSYLILRTINPATLNLSFLNVSTVPTILFEEIPPGTLQGLQEKAGQTSPQSGASTPPSPEDEKFEGDPKQGSITDQLGAVPDGGVPVPELPDPKAESMDILLPYVVAQARVNGVHPCWVIATISHESKWRLASIGHDENFNFKGVLVRARLKFLRSGVKKSKTTFSSSIPGECDIKKVGAEVREACYTAAAESIFNDDKITDEPPEFGLDWRFSHGVGLGQATLFPNSRCPNGNRGITYHGRCFTPPELATVAGSVDATIRELLDDGATMDLSKAYPESVFKNYIGGSVKDRAVVMRAGAFRGCAQSGKY